MSNCYTLKWKKMIYFLSLAQTSTYELFHQAKVKVELRRAKLPWQRRACSLSVSIR